MRAAHKAVALWGKVLGFNLSPKGIPEGILLRLPDGDQTVQVNFEPEVAGQITAVAVKGQALSVEAVAEADTHAEAHHPVFNLIRLSKADGELLFVAKGSAEADVTVRGKVVWLNYARRGEINGGILDSGEFVHLKPHGVKAIGGLFVGQTLEARGEVRAGWSGCRVIEARTANGIEIFKPHKGSGDKHKPPGPKHGPKHEAYL